MLKKDRIRRKRRIRGKISGTAERPRLTVFRSNTTIYAQVIDDVKGVTLAAAKGADSAAVGREVGEAAKKAKIDTVVFDRSGYVYHGRIKVLADAAREAGLKF